MYIENKQWGNAMQILVPLWQTLSWRQEGWWNLVEDIDRTLRQCARLIGDSETLIAVEWELLNGHIGKEPEERYGFRSCLDGLELSHPIPKTTIGTENFVSCMSATFAFAVREGHVGETLPAQLVISSRAHTNSTPISLSQIKLAFDGGLKDINIQHDSNVAPDTTSSDGMIRLHNISLQMGPIDGSSSAQSSPISLHDSQAFFGSSDLNFSAGVTKALSFTNAPHNAGTVEAVGITLCVKEKLFELDIMVSDEQQFRQEALWIKNGAGLMKKRLGNERNSLVKIYPKPPKMRIEILDLVKPYLTDEIVSLKIQLINEEEEDADVSLELRLHDQSEHAPGLNWAFDGERLESSKYLAQDGIEHSQSNNILVTSLGKISPSGVDTCKVSLQADSQAAQYGLEVKTLYKLLSNPETSISKTLITNVVFIRPFEANYDFSPRILPLPWPNYFHIDDNNDTLDRDGHGDMKAVGLGQKWLLTARIASFATEPMFLEDVRVRALDIHDRAICKIETTIDSNNLTNMISPDEVQDRQFELEVQKIDLEDRRSTILSLQLEVKWRREGSDSGITTTIVGVPEFVILFGEPRVLASMRKEGCEDGLIHLDYVIENPSMHVLTFKMNMEPSDDFAFSGAKDSSLQLVPLSRHNIQYNLLPLVRGTWINPQFRVMDTHFRKMLKVNATGGMRTNKKGVLIWVDAED